MNHSKPAEKEFGKLRSALLPIHNHELKKFLPMGLMMFFIIFIYYIVRNTKDILVMNASGGSAILPYLKGFVVMPMAMIFVVAYAQLINRMNDKKVFYTFVSFFLAFFAFFAAVVYPNPSLFHPAPETIAATIASIQSVTFLGLPIGQFCVPFIKIWGMWSYSAFYVLAELWGSMVLSLLFWQFANKVTRTVEAKRFYPLFGLVASLAPFFAGYALKYYSNAGKLLPEGADKFGYTLSHLTILLVIAGVALMATYAWMQSNILTDKRYYDESEMRNQPKKKKEKMSVGESAKFVFHSRYLMLIAMLILAYGISLNLIELVWKNQVNLAYPDKNEFGAFMGNFSMALSATSIAVIMMFKGVIHRFGWLCGAIITPMIVAITGGLFFAFILFREYVDPLIAMTGLSALALSVWVGLAQNVFSKSVKYSLFDPTKEMAYIPLDDESKTKGKAAVDVIGGRLGKAGGGYIASILLPFFGSDVLAATPVLFVIVAVVLVWWMTSVVSLNKEYQAKIAGRDA